MHVLTLTSLFPNAEQPVHCVFVRARMEDFVRRNGHDWSVVAPVPYFPKLPVQVAGTYDKLARVPLFEEPRGYPVHHPRYTLVPKVGMRWHADAMLKGVRETVRRIHAECPIDVIDAHYVYPDGAAAVALGKELGIPVVVSARGTDLNLFPDFPAIRPKIEAALADADHLICVCEELREVAVRLGVPLIKTSVIGNGVDTTRFSPGPRDVARASLGLPEEGRILLSVGHLVERKGFHVVLPAFAALPDPTAHLVLVGDGPERAALERQAHELGIEGRVTFAGARLNEELPDWYRAADVFVLASSREGWPNVLCEAQATGLPIVATSVWGIPSIVHDPSLGVLVHERTPEALAVGLATAWERDWDTDAIARVGQARTWAAVSDDLSQVFDRFPTSRPRRATTPSGAETMR